MSRLYIIGNGFDLLHKLPTKFDPDFKNIAEKNEVISQFWSLYSSYGDEIWSDFETLLGKLDFNSLEEIFGNYYPNYMSDYESDRDGIISVAEESGKLEQSLEEFAIQAEKSIDQTNAQEKLLNEFRKDDLFITFNYTHMLEKLYNIQKEKICHIHGGVSKEDGVLILGFPEYLPEKYLYDVRGKGRPPYREQTVEEYLEEMSKAVDRWDYYVHAAFTRIVELAKSFHKEPQIELMKHFLADREIGEIVIRGHSCAIDFPYFEYLANKYPTVNWLFYSFDEATDNNINLLTDRYAIRNSKIVKER